MADIRKLGTARQGIGETVYYEFDVTKWSSSPTSPSAKVYDDSNGKVDVTSTVMPTGSASASGAIITNPGMKSLIEGHVYRVEATFTGPGSNVLIPWIEVIAER